MFLDLGDAKRRIGWFIDHYNLQRPHSGIDGLVPADRYFDSSFLRFQRAILDRPTWM